MREKDKTLYMIGNAHLDLVWHWRWQEGCQEIKATFRSALDRMKEYDDFIFTCSTAAGYEWVEENEPAMFEEIRERVREGRWIIVGGWWVQPDCNVPGGESFVRQGLYAQRYFREKFGVTARTGYSVDSFGHHGMLPQILKKSGMDNYVFMRPGCHEKGLEGETFRWMSRDGSEVTAYRIPYEYCTWPEEIEEHIRRCAVKIKSGDGIAMCFYGVGNHGGGPTRRNLDSIRALDEREDLPRLLFSHPDAYFDAVKRRGEALPVVTGDLLHHASGCYSAHSGVKRWNRLAENRLIMAEKISVMAKRMSNGNYPIARYTYAWKNVLFNQFHDIMAGTSVEPAYEDARESCGAALDIAAKGLNAAVQSISWHIDIPAEEGMRPIVVVNPNAFAGRFEVEIESPGLKEGMILLDENDRQIPVQNVQSTSSSNGRTRLCFVAKLPSMGYATYRLAVRGQSESFADVTCTDTYAENDWFSIAFDEKTGYIKSLKRKQGNDGFGTEYFSAPAAVPVVIRDQSDTWAHAVRIFDTKAGQFTAASVKCVEKGPVKCVIRVISTYGSSRMIQDYNIYRELDFIRVKTMVDWHERFSMLKLQFPLNMNYMRTTSEIPYGVAQREPDGEEYPMQNFVDVEGAGPGLDTLVQGLSLLNDGKTSFSTKHKEVFLTVLRSPIYCNHEPYVPDESLEYVYMDQGVQYFNWGLYPHDGSWETAKTVERSRMFNELPTALFETYHQGGLPMHASFLSVEAENVLATVLKEAEDGSGDMVLRLVETAGRRCDTALSVFGLGEQVKLTFGAYEIKTIRIAGDGRVTETNLLEDLENSENLENLEERK